MPAPSNLKAVSDDELLRRLSELLGRSRRVEAELVAHIAEVDVRRLYAREAAASMFAYCREVLHLSEQEAYLRITVARAARKHPMLLEMLTDGRLHLSGVVKLIPHLTRANRERLLERAFHQSKRRIEELVAELAPRPDVPAGIRRLPTPRAAALSARSSRGPDAARQSDQTVGPTLTTSSAELRSAPEAAGEAEDAGAIAAPQLGPDPVGGASTAPGPRRERVEPLAPERYRVQFTASAELHGKLERLQALMRSTVPDGDLATLIELAVSEKIDRLEAQRFARVKAPRRSRAATDTTPSSRHIPAPVRRAVHERDEGQCTYVDARGRRCRARERLEFHHRTPFARGGEHSAENLALVCRAHNALFAELDYGKQKVAGHRRSAGRAPETAAGWRSGRAGGVDTALRPAATARGPGP